MFTVLKDALNEFLIACVMSCSSNAKVMYATFHNRAAQEKQRRDSRQPKFSQDGREADVSK